MSSANIIPTHVPISFVTSLITTVYRIQAEPWCIFTFVLKICLSELGINENQKFSFLIK